MNDVLENFSKISPFFCSFWTIEMQNRKFQARGKMIFLQALAVRKY